MYLCIYVFMYLCIYVFMYLCMYLCIYCLVFCPTLVANILVRMSSPPREVCGVKKKIRFENCNQTTDKDEEMVHEEIRMRMEGGTRSIRR